MQTGRFQQRRGEGFRFRSPPHRCDSSGFLAAELHEKLGGAFQGEHLLINGAENSIRSVLKYGEIPRFTVFSTSDVFQQDSAKIMVRPSWDDNAMAAMLFCQLFGDMVQRRHPPTGWTYHALFQQHFRMSAGNFYDLDLDIIHITMRIYIYIMHQ